MENNNWAGKGHPTNCNCWVCDDEAAYNEILDNSPEDVTRMIDGMVNGTISIEELHYDMEE